MKKNHLFIALLIFITFLSIFYIFPNFLSTLELRVYDSFIQAVRHFNLPSTHKNEIVIVMLDDLSFWKMQRQWPFSRAVYADLLNRISKGNPKFILFDIVFRGEGEDKEGDELFTQALKGKDNILLPYHLGDKNVHIRSKKDFTDIVGQVGYINKPLDSDSSIRRFYPFRLYLGGKIKEYATEVCLWCRYHNYDIAGIALNNRHVFLNQLNTKKEDAFKKLDFYLNADNTILINYKTNLNEFTAVSMYRVFLDDFDPQVFKDKIVLIGLTSDIFHDTYDTPLGLMPGTAVLANTALMFLDGNFIFEVPAWIRWWAIFIFCLLISLVCFRVSALKGLLFTIAMTTITTLSSFLAFLNHYYFYNPFKLILVCIISYIAVNFYKYASVVIENMQLRKLSTVDELTGLYIFRYFKIVLNHEFQKCLRYKEILSMLMIDIDNFKKINDTYGHQNGNIVLSKIGKIILNNVRRADFPARYGGEEIAILLPNTNAEGTAKIAENLRKLVEKENYFMTDSGPLKVTISIGTVSFPAVAVSSADEMIRCADAALYKAKREGKNRVVMFEKGM
ncbi:MAG: diguanylate cyclase [Candidatus Omnitrophica bacterium]|nr:diguanylate cyclase [Candidatus Omnitrophota bacterium]MDD5352712.1 diguanylate cyclase [Candidatus Omnitrophota bacterium]MDD5550311.1 diguanylate cyclase [Candidatus Omnitrophota bacterium]